MTATAIEPVTCPKCAGAVWDQKSSKFWGNGLTKNGKQKPRWECKNKECGGAVWEKTAPIVDGPTPKANPAKVPVPAHSNVSDAELPPFLRNAEPEDNAALAAKVGVDLTGIQKDLAIYQAQTEFVLRDIAPLYAAAGIGMSPESAAACVQTLFINSTGGRK